MSFGQTPPSCPSSSNIPYPSVMCIYFITCLLSIILSLICIRSYYKSVKIVGVKLRSTRISVSAWVIYFLCISLDSFIHAFQYGMDQDIEKTWEEVFLASSFIFHGFISFIFSYALRCHLKFRKSEQEILLSGRGAIPLSQHQIQDENISKIKIYFKKIRPAIDRYVVIIFIILIMFWITTILLFIFDFNDIIEGIFVFMYSLQQIPVVIFIFLILIHQNRLQDSKFTKGKLFLLIAFMLWLPDEIPLVTWSKILPDGCTLYFLSLVDVIHITYSSAIIFFFLFLRAEYYKSLEEEYWKTVNEIQLTEGIMTSNSSIVV